MLFRIERERPITDHCLAHGMILHGQLAWNIIKHVVISNLAMIKFGNAVKSTIDLCILMIGQGKISGQSLDCLCHILVDV